MLPGRNVFVSSWLSCFYESARLLSSLLKLVFASRKNSDAIPIAQDGSGTLDFFTTGVLPRSKRKFLNPKPQGLNPKPQTLDPSSGRVRIVQKTSNNGSMSVSIHVRREPSNNYG